jgi:hypothetical protein
VKKFGIGGKLREGCELHLLFNPRKLSTLMITGRKEV